MSLIVHRDALSAEVANADSTVFVALGANLPGPFGSAAASVRHAIDRLAEASDAPLHRGLLFNTPAYPAGNGPDFVNTVVAMKSAAPEAFIADAFAIEEVFNNEVEVYNQASHDFG